MDQYTDIQGININLNSDTKNNQNKEAIKESNVINEKEEKTPSNLIASSPNIEKKASEPNDTIKNPNKNEIQNGRRLYMISVIISGMLILMLAVFVTYKEIDTTEKE